MPILRQRPAKPRARYIRIEEATIASAKAGAPISLRHIYYELIEAGILRKTRSDYVTFIRIATDARRAGLLPYEWIIDETRVSGCVPWRQEKPPAIMAEVFPTIYGSVYEPDVWQFVEPSRHVELWCETRGMAGALAPTAREYGVGTTATGGMSSLALAYEAHQKMMESDGTHKIIFYVGDADDHGWKIERHIRAEFDETFAVPIDWRRLALTEAEAAERGAENPEVIPIDEMRQRVRDAIEGLVGDAAARHHAAIADHADHVAHFEKRVDEDPTLQDHLAFARQRLAEINEAWGYGTA